MAIKHITSKEFDSILQQNNLVVVDFYAPWCGPCKMFSPTLEEVANEMKEKVLIVKVSTDEERELAQKFNIRSIPTLLFFKNGNLVDSSRGVLSKSELIDKINSFL